MIQRLLLAAALSALALAIGPGALAQQFPTKPIRLIISSPPGGGVDVVARALAQKLGENMGQQVIVDNRPGGNTIISAELAAHAPADGYTLFMPLDTTMTQNPALYAKLPYDPVKDFAPISQTVGGSLIFVTHPKAPFKTLPEMVAYARANPGKLNIAASTAATQIFTLMLKNAAGIEVAYVPYKGTAPMFQALLGGEIDVVADGAPFYVPHIRSGKLVGLATSAPKRHFQLPDVPTVREAGYPQLETSNWFGVFAPAGTPQPVIEKLNAEIVKALVSADLKEKIINSGNTPSPGTPAELGALLKDDLARWTPIIKAAGIRLE